MSSPALLLFAKIISFFTLASPVLEEISLLVLLLVGEIELKDDFFVFFFFSWIDGNNGKSFKERLKAGSF